MIDGRGAARARARPRKGREGRRLPETLTVALSAGWTDRIDRAAADLGMVRSEFVRRCIRRGLDAARKRRGK